MAPNGGKRKRNERTFSQDNGPDGPGRPSPHRPSDLPLAQRGHYNQQQSHYTQQHSPNTSSYSQTPYGGDPRNQGRGGRRGGRVSRGGSYGGAPNGNYAAQNGASRGGFQRDQGVPRGNADAIPSMRDSTRPSNSQDVLSVPPIQTQETRPATPVPLLPLATLAARLSPPPLEPPKPTGPYDYEIVSEERLTNWEEAGRQAILKTAAEAFQHEDLITISTIFQELVRGGLDGKLEAGDAGSCVKVILENAPDDELIDGASLFLDTLSVLTENDMKNPRIRMIVTATDIPPSLMWEQLEDTVLVGLQLVRGTFPRMFIRKQTGILYRQSNYNLLREETEGYSKLLTELFTTSSEEPPTAEVVEDTFENIKALIGAFDLDAGRVLDVTLDVFASLLVKHCKFFVKLLRASSWWPQEQSASEQHHSDFDCGGLPAWAQPEHSSWMLDDEDRARITTQRERRDASFWNRARKVGMEAYFELGGRSGLSDVEVSHALASVVIPETEKDERVLAMLSETRSWIQDTKTLPPSGNAVAAQLLGFKLRFYASTARDSSDNLPINLIYLAALLIKIGFISLRDLYPHLWPEDSTMADVKQKQMKEKEEREIAKRPGGGALNALARAGALADDTVPAPVARLRETEGRANTPAKSDPNSSKAGTPGPKTEEEDKEPLPEPSDQKVQLLRSLLCIGAIPEALYLLGRFPWLPDAFPDLPEHIHRILHYSLHKVYEACRPLSDREGVREAAKRPDQNQAGVPKGQIRLHETTAAKPMRWAQLDKNDVDAGIDYRFYWDDWSDNVPVCHNVDDVFTLCSTFLNYIGIKLGQDPALLMKLTRIGKHSLAEDSSDDNKTRWINLCKRFLCPALSLTRANPGVVNEVFDILKLFPTQVRYSIYTEWYTGSTSRLDDVAAAFDLARAETKDVLKRMSKTNMKPMARSLAKIACASPGITFAVVLNQIESYENLIDVVVECGRYFTYMGYDVLTWCVMTTLGRAGRSRVSEDGITTSSWLASLSLFSGRIFKRYSIMSTLPILQYVLEQLRHGNFTDLRVLRELITTMAGIAPNIDFTDAQIQAMAGGELLQAQTLRQVHDKRHESKLSAKRLIKTLADNGLTGPLLISIAQQRQMCIFNSNQMSLKIIGENFDDIHIVMAQYLDMVRSNLSVEEFNAAMPDVATLISQYGLEPSIAFTIHRKSIARAIEEFNSTHKSTIGKDSRRRSSNKLDVMADVDMTDISPSGAGDGAGIAVVPEVATKLEIDQADGEAISNLDGAYEASSPNDRRITSSENSPCHPVLQGLIDSIQPFLKESLAPKLSIPFFVSFWQLSLPDVHLHTGGYTDEDKRLKDRRTAIIADRSDVTATAAKRREQERKAIEELQARLVEEMKANMKHYQLVRRRLEKEKVHWFKDFKGQWKTLNDALLQECFLPRLLISPLDAFFAYTMFKFLHSSGTPEFRTMHFLDRLLTEKMLTNLIFQCTAREAECLGRFLNDILHELSLWHASKGTYEKSAYGTKQELQGFVKQYSKEGGEPMFLGFEDYRRLYYKWHRNLNEALTSCLSNDEYMHIKNAIVVLRCVCRHFPAVNWMGSKLYGIVENLAKTEENVRPDIWVASSSLLGNLKARQKEWVLPQAFYINDAAKIHKGPGRASAAATPQPGTPVLSDTPSSLSAKASDVVPGTVLKNDTELKASASSSRVEVEDGELEDVTMENAASSTEGTIQTSASTARGAAEIAKAKALATASVQRRKSSTPAIDSKQPGTLTATVPSNHTATTIPVKATDARAIQATPQALPNIPARPDLSRNNSSSRPPSRPQHNLPGRPEAPPPARGRHPERPPDRSDTPTGHRGTEKGRLDRPADLLHQRQNARNTESPSRLESSRASTPQSRLRESGRDIVGHDSSKGRAATYDLNARERETHQGARSQESKDYSRYSAQSQLKTNTPAASPPSTSLRNDRGVAINPARAALIEGIDTPGADRGHDLREAAYARDDRAFRDQGQPRGGTHSVNADVQRTDGRPDMPRPEVVDGRRPQYEQRHPAHAPSTDFTPSGPRVRRTSIGNVPAEHGRQNILMQPPPRQPGDRSQGRIVQDQSRQPRHQDVNYGRLNAEPQSPSQGLSANEIPINGDRRRGLEASAVPMHQPPPSGPGGYRQDRTAAAGLSTSSLPQPAGAELPGVHPSRMSSLQPNGLQATGQTPNSSIDNTANAPLGPRGTQTRRPPVQDVSSSAMIPTSPSASRGPPTGPSGTHDRRRFAGLNDTLQQGGQSAASPTNAFDRSGDNVLERGTSIRGRANRQSLQAPMPSSQQTTAPLPVQAPVQTRQPLPPQDQVVPTRDEPLRREGPRGREDIGSVRANDQHDRDRDSTRHRSSRDIEHEQERELRNRDGRTTRDGRDHEQQSSRIVSESRDHAARDWDRGERDRGERESRGSRDRGYSDNANVVPPPVARQGMPPQPSAPMPQARDLRSRADVGGRDRGGRDHDQDGHRERGRGGAPQAVVSYQQAQAARTSQPSQEELFQQRLSGGQGGGVDRDRRGGGAGDGRDARKRGFPEPGHGEDVGKRMRRGAR